MGDGHGVDGLRARHPWERYSGKIVWRMYTLFITEIEGKRENGTTAAKIIFTPQAVLFLALSRLSGTPRHSSY